MIKTKDRIASGLGSILEWYDFSLYGFFAPILAQVFFPHNSQSVALIKIFTVFSIGFIARPIGSLIFGFISDKYGRVTCLKLTPLLIVVPTFIISILPGYNDIGIFSTIFLISCRILQGLCIGGEFSNNIIYLCESVHSKNRYFLGSIGSSTGSVGIFIASSVASIFYMTFSHQNLLNFGWRVAFALSLIMGLFTFLIRKNIKETNTESIKKNPIIESVKNQKSDYIKAIGLTYLSATSYYFIFIFMPNFSNHYLHTNTDTTFSANSFSLFSHLLITLTLGIVADRVGGVLMTRISSILFIFLSFPIVYILIKFPQLFFYCIYIFGLMSSLNAANLPGLLVSILKQDTRSTIFSFSFNLCFGTFGGLVPLISFYLIEKTNILISPVYYLIFSAVVTLVTSFFIFGDKRKNVN